MSVGKVEARCINCNDKAGNSTGDNKNDVLPAIPIVRHPYRIGERRKSNTTFILQSKSQQENIYPCISLNIHCVPIKIKGKAVPVTGREGP
jgi:hypothetical protein